MKHSSDFLITSNVRKYSSDFLMNSNVSYPESNCNSAKNESLKCIVEETILSNNKNPNDSSWLQLHDEERRQARIVERRMKSIGKSASNNKIPTIPESQVLNQKNDKNFEIKEKTELTKIIEYKKSMFKLKTEDKPNSNDKTTKIDKNREDRIKKKKEEYTAVLEKDPNALKASRFVKDYRKM